MKKISIFILMLLFAGYGRAQVVELNLQECRKLAVEHSKKLQSAEQQMLKSGFEKNAYRANFLPKISATGMYAYVQKKMKYKIDGGYLPVFDEKDKGSSLPVNSVVFELSRTPVPPHLYT